MFPPSTVNVQNRLQWWNNWGIITIVLGESNPSEVGMRYWEGQKQSFQCKHFPKCCPSPHTRKWQNILGFGMVTVGIHPNRFKVFNVHPNGIPTKKNIETCSVKLPAAHTFLVSRRRLSKLRTSLLEMFALSPANRSPYWSEYLEIVLIQYSWFQSVLFLINSL